MELAPYLTAERVLVLPDCQDHDELLGLLARVAAEALPDHRPEDLLHRLRERERSAPTGTREGVAFPHVLADDIDETIVVIARAPRGVSFGEHEPVTCDLAFCMFGDARKPWIHVHLLARMARLVHTEASRRRLRAAETSDDLLEALRAEDRDRG